MHNAHRIALCSLGSRVNNEVPLGPFPSLPHHSLIVGSEQDFVDILDSQLLYSTVGYELQLPKNDLVEIRHGKSHSFTHHGGCYS